MGARPHKTGGDGVALPNSPALGEGSTAAALYSGIFLKSPFTILTPSCSQCE